MKKLKLHFIILTTFSLLFSFNSFAQTTTNFGAYSGGLDNPNYSGDNGSFFGFRAGEVTIAGTWNTFIGSRAGSLNINGYHNTFIGGLSGASNTTGQYNVFVGTNSGFSNTTGRDNTFIGRQAGKDNTTARFNTFMGINAGANTTTGGNNTMLGGYAGYNNLTGIDNVYIGRATGLDNTNGSKNVCIGPYAGSQNLTGNRNVCIGNRSGHYETESDKLHIANTENKTLVYGKFDTDQVAIGTTDNYIPNGFTLAVGGKMIAEEVKVRLRANWPDYVFDEDYQKPTLKELESSIKENGHLPNIPSAEQVAADGYLLGEMDVKLLEKVEELTLYMIDINKEVKSLKVENEKLKELVGK